MWRRVIDRMSAISQSYGRVMERISNPTTNKDFVLGLVIFGGAWAIAWYAHIVFPWIESVLGWSPSTPDSEGKVRWRRIWSTAICLPGILAISIMHIRRLRQRGRQNQRSE